MSEETSKGKIQLNFIFLLVVIITLLFLAIIWEFILALLIAAIISGLLYPVYKWILKKVKGRRSLASFTVLCLLLLVIVLPSIFIVSVIVKEALMVSDQLTPLVQNQIRNSDTSNIQLPGWIPFANELEPYKAQIFTKISELAGRAGGLLVSSLTAFTQGTFLFFLNLFIMLYALYFFLIRGEKLIDQAYHYVPLDHDDFQLLIDQGLSITRATLKGALLIGILQGSLVGLAFWVVGIKGAAFWGAIAAVMSVIPSIGSGAVIIPAVVYLLLTGEPVEAIGLAIWGGVVVGSVDNLLRPYLVGKDTQMSDLLVLVSTLGGLSLFGLAGFVLGPIIAGLLIPVWNIYRHSLSKSAPDKVS